MGSARLDWRYAPFVREPHLFYQEDTYSLSEIRETSPPPAKDVVFFVLPRKET